MNKTIYEKLGLFYLGKDLDTSTLQQRQILTLLKNKDFTTHAAIIGMTGSGKTGLGIGLIEEAAMDNIPAIVIDPKGDMGDLCLSDPTFSAENFTPWVKDEALSKGEDPAAYGEKIANIWKNGIEEWEQDSNRVKKFNAVTKTIYTPGSSAGVSINILASLEVPPQNIMDESDTLTALLKSTVSSLLALIDIKADPINSKEYIILSQIILYSWQQKEDVSIEALIGSIINPPFKKIGILPLDSYYPQNERFELATRFNAVLASPAFASWIQGERLNIQNLLYDSDGKAKIAIFSIAHLSDNERMFFVTLLLNRYIAWMRQQSGTSSLKNILYMDEIFGFFPPGKNPPSKEPMLLLLKQARAFGVGIVLSTQNPVDLDYKGLSNIATWFVGRLQTPQDIERVIDGLSSKSSDEFDRKKIKELLTSLPKRTFLLKSTHLDTIKLFATRWVMSYLKGPLKKDEIKLLMQKQKEQTASLHTEAKSAQTKATEPLTQQSDYQEIVTVDTSIPQYYEIDPSEQNRYTPYLKAITTISFFNQSRGIDEKEELQLELRLDENKSNLEWSEAYEEDINDFTQLPTQAPTNATRLQVPKFLTKDKELKKSKKLLQDWLYHNKRLQLFRSKSPKLESKPYETLSDFKVRLQDLLNEKQNDEIEKLKERYATKEKSLQERLSRAYERLEKEEADVNSKTTDTVISIGMAVFGAFFGGRSSSSRIGSSLSKGARILKEKEDVVRAERKVQEIKESLQELFDELEEKIDKLNEKYLLQNTTIEEFSIKPRRNDIVIEKLALVWTPC